MAEQALYQHCEQVYQTMFANSELREIEGEEAQIYEGFLTKLITRDLHFPNPYYTFITEALKNMDCIQQLRRGGGSTPSEWLLKRPPTPELFRTHTSDGARYGGQNVRIEQLQQQLKDLNARVNTLEEAVLG